MAKIKASTIILSLAAIAIWCVVGYRVYRWIFPREQSVLQTAPRERETGTGQSDTLLLNYRDPFFPAGMPSRPSARSGAPAPSPVAEKPLPTLTYKGLIRDGGGRVKAMISFEGRVEGYPVGAMVGGARIKGIKADYVIVEWQGKEHTIKAR